MPAIPGKILSTIDHPADLKKLSQQDLVTLSRELRQFIIDEVSANPGHFGASLGVVELTVALHYVFNTPYDRIIWDVGHQAYGHKILTGRREKFHTNRKFKGISGFPRMDESEYDSFGVGHSSTSISAALGMAVASKLKNEKDRQIICVIGDGSMTGGEAFEGLNNAGAIKSDILVILNDNHMAIDPNVGALEEYLLDVSTSKTYNKVKEDVWRMLGKISKWGPNAREIIHKIDTGIKAIVLRHSNLFESLNFRYFGPVDGHDVIYLTKLLNDLKKIPGPKLLHCITVKGKGFEQAEKEQTIWHAPGKFDKDTGIRISTVNDNGNEYVDYQEVFGNTILDLAEMNPKIVGITPAMPSGCSLNIMMEKMPERAFDVGIAEQHAVTFAAGMASQGMLPFCNIYSSFMQRSFDQAIHDVALQKLNVVFCLDRGGLVGADGATHHGAFDLAFMRIIPNMTVSAPMNEEELRNLMYTAQLENKGPFTIRYPRGKGVMLNWRKDFTEIPVGKGRKLIEGSDLAVLTIGTTGNFIADISEKLSEEKISISHYDMRFVKPIDTELLHEVFSKFKKVLTIEDGIISGGFGSAVIEFMCTGGYSSKVVRMGIPDRFVEHGTQEQLYNECGFGREQIFNEIKKLRDTSL